MATMADAFSLQCIRLLEADDNDINTRGWKEMYKMSAIMFQSLNLVHDELEVVVTGSTVEEGKFIWPNDIGDLDVMIRYKDDITPIADLVDLPGHPGFVKVINSQEEGGGYLKTSTLKDCLPSYFVDIPKHALLQDSFMKVQFEKNGPATTLNFRSSAQSPLRNFMGMGHLEDHHTAFFENFARVMYAAAGKSDDTIDETSREHFINTWKEKMKQTFESEPTSDFNTFIKRIFKASLETNDTPSDNTEMQSHASTRASAEKNISMEETRAACEENAYDSENAQKSKGENTRESPKVDDLKDGDESQVKPTLTSLKNQESSSTRLGRAVTNRMFSTIPTSKSPQETTSGGETEPIRKQGIDWVMAKKLEGWPKHVADEFCTRAKRVYPTQHVLQEVMASPVYIVAKSPSGIARTDEELYCFRYSFSEAERVLFKHMGEVPVLCYRLMKIIHHAFFKTICSKIGEGQTCFSSYHIKTLLFWAVECNDEDIWRLDNFQECIGMLLLNLLIGLQEGMLEHYFVRDVNILKDIPQSQLDELSQTVTELMDDTQSALTKIENQFLEITNTVSCQTVKQGETTATTAQPGVTGVFDPGFYQKWSNAYDQMTCQFMNDVFKNEPSEEPSKFPSHLLDLFKSSGMSRENTSRVFIHFKQTSLQKHALNMKDAQRPLAEIIIEDIEAVSQLLKWVLQIPPEKLSEEYANEALLTGLENNDSAATAAVDALIPDVEEILDSFANMM